jgi:uncharacterized protein
MTLATERRVITTQFEVRHAPTRTVIEGYAAKFNARSQDLGGFVEQIDPRAFNKTVQEADVRALLNHDPNLVLGRTASGTLRLATDESGLYYEVDLPDTSYARDLKESMRRGDISQSSFGFRTISDDWGLTEDSQTPLRTLREVALSDVSPVTYPAYLDSTSGISQRSYELLAKRFNLPVETVQSCDLRSLLAGEGPRNSSDTAPGSPTLPSDELRRFLRRRESNAVRDALQLLAGRD